MLRGKSSHITPLAESRCVDVIDSTTNKCPNETKGRSDLAGPASPSKRGLRASMQSAKASRYREHRKSCFDPRWGL
jgi:hypothetical protein